MFEISNNYGTSWEINILDSPPPLNIQTPTRAPGHLLGGHERLLCYGSRKPPKFCEVGLLFKECTNTHTHSNMNIVCSFSHMIKSGRSDIGLYMNPYGVLDIPNLWISHRRIGKTRTNLHLSISWRFWCPFYCKLMENRCLKAP